MPSYKTNRQTEDIRRELADIMRSLKDPRVTGLLSIVSVELSNDLTHCKVRVSSMQGLGAAQEAVKGLSSAAGFIRHEINNRLTMRRSPEFHFEADDSIEYSAGISQRLHELMKDKEQ